jgi:hypothetical protein
MKGTKRFGAVAGPTLLGCILTIVAGCGGEESAGSDPVARAQTESEAKNAMASTSKKKSDGVSRQQGTKSAMEAGARQQKKGGK